METEITLRATFSTKDEKQNLAAAIDDEGLIASIHRLANDVPGSELADGAVYRDSLESLAVTAQDQTSITFAATCGSEGWDFLLGLVEIFGPRCSGVDATFMHDEEPDEGEWPVRVEYVDGEILVNGKPRGGSSSGIDLEGKRISLAVMQNEFLVEDIADEMEVFDIEVQQEINDKTDYVVYFGADSEDLAGQNDEALLEQARKDGRKLLTYFEVQDLLYELTEKYA